MLLKKAQRRNAPSETKDYYDETKLKAGDLSASRKMTIGVAGAMPRIGTTTQALQIARYIFTRQKKVAYIQAFESDFVDALRLNYTDVTMDKYGNVLYNRIPLVKRDDIQTVAGDDFEYLVFDYGSYTNTGFDTVSFLERNTQILVGGSAPQELNYTTDALSDKIFLNSKILFNLVPEDDQKAVERMMQGREDDTFFSGYQPDMFSYYGIMDRVYEQILPKI